MSESECHCGADIYTEGRELHLIGCPAMVSDIEARTTAPRTATSLVFTKEKLEGYPNAEPHCPTCQCLKPKEGKKC